MSTKKKVLVAMSGGVDSSVSALLLKKQGFDVTGIGLKLIDNNLQQICDSAGSCCGKEGFEDAKKVAGKIGIPFYVLDASNKFKKLVLEYFVKSYFSGKTPNPCIICNEKIKFDILIKHAEKLDIDYIATGHYSKIVYNEKKSIFSLYKAKDRNKDQSYFLSTLNREYLKKTIFPLGDLNKTETRQIASKYNLPVKNKSESQDICFLKEGKYDRFLESYSGKKFQPGPIKNREGEILGTHNGFIRYTIGQRRGLGIADKEPLYVIEINPSENTIIAGYKKDVYKKETSIENIHWINKINKKDKLENITVKIRSNHKAVSSSFEMRKDNAIIRFQTPQPGITPGQAAVLYKGNELIGSGWITGKN